MSAPAAATTIPLPRALPVVTQASPAATCCCLFTADAAAVLLARWLGATLWSLVNPLIGHRNQFDLWMSLVLFLMVYAVFGLYSASGLGAVEELRRIVLGAALVSLVLTTAAFLSKTEGVYSRGVFLSSGLLVALLAPLHRAAVRRCFAGRDWWGTPALILSAGSTARLVIETLRTQPNLGLKPVACLDDNEDKLGDCAGIAIVGPLSLAPELSRTLHIRHAIVAMPDVESERLVFILERWGAAFSNVIVIPNLFGIATLWVSTKDLGGVLGLEVRQNLLIPANRWLKRGLDLAIAGLLGLLALPVLGAAALWIRITSRSAALYFQEREGEAGRKIRVWKLRTMYPDADAMLARHLHSCPEARQEWTRYFKLKQDPRILPGIGRLLRRTSLDELPQLWNVLKGEMSLVGPRPFPDYHLESFAPEFRALRSKVPPGLTGMWQVSARSNGDIRVQEALDTYYIRNWSPWLDLHILARTVGAVLLSDGAY
jgi:Undecaprenyl-phosphate galactose phosphotransferase WbaP